MEVETSSFADRCSDEMERALRGSQLARVKAEARLILRNPDLELASCVRHLNAPIRMPADPRDLAAVFMRLARSERNRIGHWSYSGNRLVLAYASALAARYVAATRRQAAREAA